MLPTHRAVIVFLDPLTKTVHMENVLIVTVEFCNQLSVTLLEFLKADSTGFNFSLGVVIFGILFKEHLNAGNTITDLDHYGACLVLPISLSKSMTT